MTDIKLINFKIGESKRRFPIWPSILGFIISAPFRMLYFFIPFMKNYTDVPGDWFVWIKNGNREIHRKNFAETGFDGLIKFYKIKFKNDDLNNLVEDKSFGVFYFEINHLIFLREFKTPNQWPKSYLSVINKSNNTISRLKLVSSSYTDWKVESINQSEFNIITIDNKEYTEGIKVTTPNNV